MAKSGDNIFGRSVSEITAEQEAARQKSLAVLIEQMKKKNMSPSETAGLNFGAQLGSALVSSMAEKWFPNPEITKQKNIEAGMQEVDTNWEDNPDATPGENAAAKYEAYQDRIGQFLAPGSRLLLAGKIAALRADAFNQSRALRADGRADQASIDAHNAALARIDIEKARKADAERKAQYGGDIWEFKFPDGSLAPAPQGSDKYQAYLKMVDEGQAEIAGPMLERLKTEDAMRIAKDKLANTPAKIYKVPNAVQETYNDLNQMSILLGGIASPEGQKGLERSGGVTNMLDRAQDAVANHLGTWGGLLPGLSDSAFFKTMTDKMRIVSQALIKGVPSNADQAINELSNVATNVDPNINAMRIKIITDDAADRMRSAYADFKLNAAPGQPPPQALLRAMARMGIDASSVGTAEEEYARLNSRADETIKKVADWKVAAGIEHKDDSAAAPASTDAEKPKNSVVGPNGTVVTW